MEHGYRQCKARTDIVWLVDKREEEEVRAWTAMGTKELSLTLSRIVIHEVNILSYKRYHEFDAM